METQTQTQTQTHMTETSSTKGPAISPLAGKPAPPELLTDLSKLVTRYYTGIPDPAIAEQRVAFGTSGHRGSSFRLSFNEGHILAISQALCQYRRDQQIDGPLFLGIDTHGLSEPAYCTALEVFAANGVEVMIATNDEYTPTPAVSLAILHYNRGRKTGLADGIVITPSHNPPADGGFKYNPPQGGASGPAITNVVQAGANKLLESGLVGVKRMAFDKALNASTTHRYNFLDLYLSELGSVVDMDTIRGSKIRMGVDPLGGAGVHYWPAIAEHFKLDLTIVNPLVDATFRFMTVDWDGQIRMDPSSPYAMQRIIVMKDQFDISFACDTDHDRHGIVAPSVGLIEPNHNLCVMIQYLFNHRPKWSKDAGVGKTVVSSQMIDRVTESLGRKLYEVPVGFKWFEEGLLNGSLGFVGEESAGASFLRTNGSVWTTDKDGIIAALLSAEIKAVTGKDAGQLYQDLTRQWGDPVYERREAKATPAQKKALANLKPDMIKQKELAGEPIISVETNAPSNGAPIGGLRVKTKNGWFAVRPSGTEDIYKIYAESFLGQDHVEQIIDAAQELVNTVI
jgi:phosphoglucomutase